MVQTLIIKDATTDSQLLDAIFADLAIKKNMNLRNNDLQPTSNTRYNDIEEVETNLFSFVETMKNKALEGLKSKEDKKYVTDFYKNLANSARTKLYSGSINAMIEKGFHNFCAAHNLNANASSNDFNAKIDETFKKSFVKKDYAEYVRKENKKANKEILKEIMKNLKGTKEDLISSISASEFIEEGPRNKIKADKIADLISQGKAFTETGQLREGLNLDGRSPLAGMGLGKLSHLETYILSALIINASKNYVSKNYKGSIEDDPEDPIALAKGDLTKLSQTHFCMMLKDSDKKSLLKEARAAAKEIQSYALANENIKTPTSDTVSMSVPSNTTPIQSPMEKPSNVRWKHVGFDKVALSNLKETGLATSRPTQGSDNLSPTSIYHKKMLEGREAHKVQEDGITVTVKEPIVKP